ncbi:phosphonoacetate hydrolase [Pseudonocardia acaciae]|uniref:phosphonoacetate hydrolase n=1 Tax=Pseudonocardia acaciae TaxID=551276 RepID=UPI00048F57CD|nr:phosphonoacetate hydrolase [Pseudonocardia acaciae]
MALPRIEVNGRRYGATEDTVVVVCVDGSEPAYHERAIQAGHMPFFEKLLANGTSLPATCAMPSFTNPNNLSIATGVPPSVHGICGNYFFDRDTGEEVMMNDPKWLRVPTLFAEYASRGATVAVVTAKDKLRRLLGSGLAGGMCFSAEHADKVNRAEYGIDDVLGLVGMPRPSVYSAELSELVMAAGVAVLRRDRPDLMYLSLTDYVQHKHAPGSAEANAFYAMLDGYCQRLDELGCVLVVTADHGMNAKSGADGAPEVVYLQELLDGWLGAGAARVILPITDPYTVHHGALGSFATVYLSGDAKDVDGVAHRLAEVPGVELALGRDDAAARFELPADRMGELVVIGDRGTALGTTPDRHDLSQLGEPLRSHGGLAEQRVPFLVNRAVRELPQGHELHNYDAYWVATNFVA